MLLMNQAEKDIVVIEFNLRYISLVIIYRLFCYTTGGRLLVVSTSRGNIICKYVQ